MIHNKISTLISDSTEVSKYYEVSQESFESSLTSQIDQDEYNYVEMRHSQDILIAMNELRESGNFCDVTLVADNEEFNCHRLVLSAYSSYFKAMFVDEMAERYQSKITLKGIEPSILRQLIDFAYTASITITKTNCQLLLSASNLLDVGTVREACCRFLACHMDPSNVLGIYCFAELHTCTELQQKAKSYALKFFQEVMFQEEFNVLSQEKVIEFLTSNELRINQEEEVFEAALRWLNHDLEARSPNFNQVLKHVRLCLISPYFLHDHVITVPAISSNTESKELVEKAIIYHLLPDRRNQFSGIGNKPRFSMGLVDVMVAVGGEDDKVVLRSVECFEPLRAFWHNLACLPFAVSRRGLVVTGNNMLYMAGGEFPDGTASNSVWRYDPVFDVWQEMAPMNVTRSELGLATLDGFIYALGGWEGTVRLASVERYDPTTNKWNYIEPMRVALTSPSVVSYGGVLYVAGGSVMEDGDGIDLVQCYNPRTNKWTDNSTMLIPRSGSAACVVKDNIYIIGGWHASTENTNKVEKFNLHTKEWKECAPMNERRYQPGVAVINEKIYICGGEEGWDKYHESIECYDPDKDQWSFVGIMQTSRSWLACAHLQIKLSHQPEAS